MSGSSATDAMDATERCTAEGRGGVGEAWPGVLEGAGEAWQGVLEGTGEAWRGVLRGKRDHRHVGARPWG